MQDILIIKRYKNRKLYDTESSRYLNIVEVQKTALNRPIMVIDNETKQDITSRTLTMSLVENIESISDLELEGVLKLIKDSKL